MLLTIQYAFFDARSLQPNGGDRLAKPVWPMAQPNRDFIRAVGGVKRRWLGGGSNWIAEGVHCDARRAVRFDPPLRNVMHLQGEEGRKPYRARVNLAFRRLYCDGAALWKLELGFSINLGATIASESLQGLDWQRLIEDILALTVYLGSSGDPRALSVTLGNLGKPLADWIHMHTSKTGQHREGLVCPGKPVVALQFPAYRTPIRWPGLYGEKRIFGQSGAVLISLANMTVRSGGQQLTLILSPSSIGKFTREIRIALLRLCAIEECLRLAIEQLAVGKLVIEPKSEASDCWQKFCRNAIRRLCGKDDNSRSHLSTTLQDSQLIEDVRSALYTIDDSKRQAILVALDNLDIRPQTRNQIGSFVNNITVNNQYNISGGQFGAVGDGASANGSTFTNNVMLGPADLEKLKAEVATLRLAMEGRESSVEANAATQRVTAADAAFRAGDAPKALEILKGAGKWAVEVAKEVGAKAVAEFIMQALKG